MDYATLAATTARLGFRPQDVAETVGMDARRFRRIRTGKYEVPDWLAEKGFDPMYGARPLKRLVQKEIGDALARLILKGEVHDGEHVEVTARQDGSGLDLVVAPEDGVVEAEPVEDEDQQG